MLDKPDTYLRKLTRSEEGIYETSFLDKIDDFETLEYNHKTDTRSVDEQERKRKKEEEEKPRKPYDAVIYFDFETTTDGEIHNPYLVCFSERESDDVTVCEGSDCGLNMLKILAII